ncbi:MAG: aldo/keto reductase [Firmicutes bacterium]|nr:aldo/keto reductase [Bacillota bacterium]
MKRVSLHNGVFMPIVGLGTWRSSKEDAYNAVLSALKAGYRHIDTAMIYGNEEAVGKAIQDSNIPRNELFITTKLWNSDQGYETTKQAFHKSLKNLGLEYIDLYLIHWFKGYEQSMASYKAMEELHEEGLAKAIGVSNYNVHHITNLIENCKIVPHVLQVETHIALQNHFLQDFCIENKIQMEAYAPLMSSHIEEMLSNPVMKELANKYHKTIPQIAIRWLIDRSVVVIPKSVTESRIIANYDVFDFKIDQDDMQKIKGLNQGKKFFPEPDNVIF